MTEHEAVGTSRLVRHSTGTIGTPADVSALPVRSFAWLRTALNFESASDVAVTRTRSRDRVRANTIRQDHQTSFY